MTNLTKDYCNGLIVAKRRELNILSIKALRAEIPSSGDRFMTEVGGEMPRAPQEATQQGSQSGQTTAEPFWDFKASHWITAFLSVVLIFVGIFQACVYVHQAKISRDQLTLTFPPKLDVVGLHIWNKENGHPFGANNPFPTLIPNSQIEGAAFAVNSGRESAFIQQSNCMIVWQTGKLTMNNPAWGVRGKGFRRFRWEPDEYLFDETSPDQDEIKSGEAFRCSFDSEVPAESEKDLYAFGIIFYRDRLGTNRQTYFARRYDPTTHLFIRSKDPDYEGFR